MHERQSALGQLQVAARHSESSDDEQNTDVTSAIASDDKICTRFVRRRNCTGNDG